jgi:hypothetical protein
MTTTQELIAECIAYETAERDAAAADEKHYWDEWSEEDMLAGTPFVSVTVTAPGLGRESCFVAHLMIRGASGKCGSVRDGHMEKVATRKAAWRDGLDGYAKRLAAKLYGPGIPVEFKHLV